MKRIRFSIRDLLLLTTIAAVALGWWLNNRENAQQINALEQRINVLELDTRKWHVWTQHLSDQLNGTKVGGKWLLPRCYVFEPGAEKLTTPKRQAPGDSLVSPSSPFEWRKEWVKLR